MEEKGREEGRKQIGKKWLESRTQDCWLQFHVCYHTVHRRFGHDADDEKKAFQIVFLDGEEPERFEDSDIACQKRERHVGTFPAFGYPLGHRAVKIRYLDPAKKALILPREMVIVHGRVDQVEFSEIESILIHNISIMIYISYRI